MNRCLGPRGQPDVCPSPPVPLPPRAKGEPEEAAGEGRRQFLGIAWVSLKTPNLRRSLLLFFAILWWPSSACAHLVTTGSGPVYDGIGHLVLTPEDLIPSLAIGLLAGLHGAALGRRALFILPLAWFGGGLLGVFITALPAWPLPALSFLILGVLIAADLNLSGKGFTALLIAVGFVHGGLNGIALREGPGILGLVGIVVTLFVILALASAFVVALQKPWTRVVVRVAGSWVAAMGLLMLGWLARGSG